MTTHNILKTNKIAAADVAAWVRPVVCASAVDNGNVFQLLTVSGTDGEGEVFLATAPTSASATDCWMAAQPEQPFGAVGNNTYYGIGNITDFYNSASAVFTAFKLQKGDIIEITADGLDSSTTAAYAVPVLGTFKFAWAAAASTGLTLRYLSTKYIPVGSGSAIGGGRVVSYRFEVYGI
jgi:hypothetical protein